MEPPNSMDWRSLSLSHKTNNIRDAESVILSNSKTLSSVINQLQAFSKSDQCDEHGEHSPQPDKHGKRDPDGRRESACDAATALLNQLDAVILAQGEHVDTLKNELIPAFSDPDGDGLPTTFDSEPGGGD